MIGRSWGLVGVVVLGGEVNLRGWSNLSSGIVGRRGVIGGVVGDIMDGFSCSGEVVGDGGCYVVAGGLERTSSGTGGDAVVRTLDCLVSDKS